MTQDWSNPFAMPFACPRCRDNRMVARYASARKEDLVPCDKCGLMGSEEYSRFRRDAWAQSMKPPEITQLDLTPEEFQTYEAMRAAHPNVSRTSILSWLEGQRYNPAEDIEFLEDARAKFKEWRAR